jgi:hypothetical protein
MEGAEHFDFFRQPDFIKDPFLKGSYAVYKKQTFIGEGTGKLCHIHRPLIIDAMGKKVFGDLSVVGNRLCITIPENWLSEAKYPVVVDPTIGTTTVGSLEKWYDPGNGDEDDDLNWKPLWFEISIAVNKFAVSQAINGECLAYVYVNDGLQYDENRPVIYSDNGNKPLNRLTKEEGRIDSAVTSSKPKGWRTASFKTKNSIPSGSNIWFGVCSSYWETRFDYGQRIFVDEFDYQDPIVIPDVYPQGGLGWYDTHPEDVAYYFNYKVSWYFTYTAAQNYTRTLTQGVTLADSRKHTANYKRVMTVNARGTTLLGHSSNYYREHINGITVTDTASRFRGFFRSLTEQLQTGDFTSYCRDFLRTIAVTVQPKTCEQRALAARRDVTDHAGTGDSTGRQRGFIRTLVMAVSTGDYAGKVITLLRGIREEAAALGEAGHVGDYLRGLYTEAGSMAETKHEGDYYRSLQDTAHSEALPLRHLFIFIRLLTGAYIRDYIIGRFLKSKEELVIKSHVCREITLDSTLH